jgi:hypothetical protein
MAGTEHDNSRSDDAWWFLSPSLSRLAKVELAFVTQWTWHEKPAKELLWDGAADRSIRWYAEIEIVEDNLVFKTRAGLLTMNTAVNRGLWQRNYFSMNWEASEGTYIGPSIVLRPNPQHPEEVGLSYDGRASVRIMARLMRFHHGDVERELCHRGLMEEPVSEPTSSPSEAPPNRQEPVSEWPSAEQLDIAKAPKQRAILRKWPELCQRYPNIYNADKVRAGEVSGGRLAQHVGDVDPDSARTFLRALRTWLERRS